MYRLYSSEHDVRPPFRSLSSEQLAAVIMHKYEGMDYEQIAQILECSVADLKSLLLQGYATLRKPVYSAPATAHL
jgi:RNA polymerase sigma-70 factor, ECF subfamily